MQKDQLGLACWGLRELPLEEQLALTRRLGVNAMEFSIANAPKDFPLTITDADMAWIRKRYEQAQIPLTYVVTGNDFTQPDPAAVEADRLKVQRVIELCAALGAKTLRIFAGFSPAEVVVGERFTRMAEAITAMAGVAEQNRITLALELHGGVTRSGAGMKYIHSVTTRMDRLEELLACVPQSVALLLDPANLWAVGVTDPLPYYQKFRDRIAYIHVKDFATLPDGSLRPAACGASALDWRGFMHAARDYRGALMVEYENPEDVEQGMRTCLDSMQTLLTQ